MPLPIRSRALLPLALIALGACANHKAPPPPPTAAMLPAPPAQPAPPYTVRVGVRDDGQLRTLVPGQQLSVTLTTDFAAGYRWEVDQIDPRVVRELGKPTYVQFGDRPDARVVQTLRFEGVGPGRSQLRLIYHRPTDPDSPPAYVYTVIVNVP
ncbi:MAG TPA: protease inhibitor I42 family protein [Longimicrobiales bacterium]|nr:protease inhibitor I42 family protein [Longimicrobiales bacterium]